MPEVATEEAEVDGIVDLVDLVDDRILHIPRLRRHSAAGPNCQLGLSSRLMRASLPSRRTKRSPPSEKRPNGAAPTS